MFRNILVPLDGSALSERALAPALKIAELEGSRVTLLRTPVVDIAVLPSVEVFGNYSLRGLDEATSRARRDAREYLETLRKSQGTTGLELRPEVQDGDPAEAILTAAQEKHADLIAMSTHGYSGVTRWIMGSVTERVLAHAPCPVLVLRSEKPFSHLLITLDGSALSEKALAPAFEIASAYNIPVTLLRVINPVPAWHVAELNEVEQGLGYRLHEELEAEAANYLRQQLAAYRYPQLRVEVAVRAGPPAATILDYAQTHGVDVVAMATHGRTGTQKWLYGSVTEKVLRQSHDFAMLVVRA
jgi:nucleotide-binding universal stress UspA family protein